MRCLSFHCLLRLRLPSYLPSLHPPCTGLRVIICAFPVLIWDTPNSDILLEEKPFVKRKIHLPESAGFPAPEEFTPILFRRFLTTNDQWSVQNEYSKYGNSSPVLWKHLPIYVTLASKNVYISITSYTNTNSFRGGNREK